MLKIYAKEKKKGKEKRKKVEYKRKWNNGIKIKEKGKENRLKRVRKSVKQPNKSFRDEAEDGHLV